MTQKTQHRGDIQNYNASPVSGIKNRLAVNDFSQQNRFYLKATAISLSLLNNHNFFLFFKGTGIKTNQNYTTPVQQYATERGNLTCQLNEVQKYYYYYFYLAGFFKFANRCRRGEKNYVGFLKCKCEQYTTSIEDIFLMNTRVFLSIQCQSSSNLIHNSG